MVMPGHSEFVLVCGTKLNVHIESCWLLFGVNESAGPIILMALR